MYRLLSAFVSRTFSLRVLAFLASLGAVKFMDGSGFEHPDYDVDIGTGTPDAPSTPTGVTPAAPTGTGPDPSQPPRPAGEVPGAPVSGQQERGGPPQSVPYHRFAEVNEAVAREREARIRAEERARLLEEQRQPAPQAVEESDEDREIRDNLERLYPALKQLKSLPIDKVLASLERVESIDANDQARWEEVGRATWTALDKAVEEHFGGPIADPDVKAMIDDAFQSWLKRDRTAQAMYLRQDPQLVPTFWKRYTGGIVRPAVRRAEAESVTTAQARQPRAPRGGSGTSVVTSAPKQPSVKNPDEVHDAAAEAFLTRRG